MLKWTSPNRRKAAAEGSDTLPRSQGKDTNRNGASLPRMVPRELSGLELFTPELDLADRRSRSAGKCATSPGKVSSRQQRKKRAASTSLPSSPHDWKKSSEQLKKPHGLMSKVRSMFRRSSSKVSSKDRKRGSSLPSTPKVSHSLRQNDVDYLNKKLSPDEFNPKFKSRLLRKMESRKQQRKLIRSLNEKRDPDDKYVMMSAFDDEGLSAPSPKKKAKDRDLDGSLPLYRVDYDLTAMGGRGKNWENSKKSNQTKWGYMENMSVDNYTAKTHTPVKHGSYPRSITLNSLMNPFVNKKSNKRLSLGSEGSIGLYENHVITENTTIHDTSTYSPIVKQRDFSEDTGDSWPSKTALGVKCNSTDSIISASEYEQSLAACNATGGRGMVKVMPIDALKLIQTKLALTPPKDRDMSKISPTRKLASPKSETSLISQKHVPTIQKENHKSVVGARNNNNGHHGKKREPDTILGLNSFENDSSTKNINPPVQIDHMESPPLAVPTDTIRMNGGYSLAGSKERLNILQSPRSFCLESPPCVISEINLDVKQNYDAHKSCNFLRVNNVFDSDSSDDLPVRDSIHIEIEPSPVSIGFSPLEILTDYDESFDLTDRNTEAYDISGFDSPRCFNATPDHSLKMKTFDEVKENIVLSLTKKTLDKNVAGKPDTTLVEDEKKSFDSSQTLNSRNSIFTSSLGSSWGSEVKSHVSQSRDESNMTSTFGASCDQNNRCSTSVESHDHSCKISTSDKSQDQRRMLSTSTESRNHRNKLSISDKSHDQKSRLTLSDKSSDQSSRLSTTDTVRHSYSQNNTSENGSQISDLSLTFASQSLAERDKIPDCELAMMTKDEVREEIIDRSEKDSNAKTSVASDEEFEDLQNKNIQYVDEMISCEDYQIKDISDIEAPSDLVSTLLSSKADSLTEGQEFSIADIEEVLKQPSKTESKLGMFENSSVNQTAAENSDLLSEIDDIISLASKQQIDLHDIPIEDLKLVNLKNEPFSAIEDTCTTDHTANGADSFVTDHLTEQPATSGSTAAIMSSGTSLGIDIFHDSEDGKEYKDLNVRSTEDQEGAAGDIEIESSHSKIQSCPLDQPENNIAIGAKSAIAIKSDSSKLPACNYDTFIMPCASSDTGASESESCSSKSLTFPPDGLTVPVEVIDCEATSATKAESSSSPPDVFIMPDAALHEFETPGTATSKIQKRVSFNLDVESAYISEPTVTSDDCAVIEDSSLPHHVIDDSSSSPNFIKDSSLPQHVSEDSSSSTRAVIEDSSLESLKEVIADKSSSLQATEDNSLSFIETRDSSISPNVIQDCSLSPNAIQDCSSLHQVVKVDSSPSQAARPHNVPYSEQSKQGRDFINVQVNINSETVIKTYSCSPPNNGELSKGRKSTSPGVSNQGANDTDASEFSFSLNDNDIKANKDREVNNKSLTTKLFTKSHQTGDPCAAEGSHGSSTCQSEVDGGVLLIAQNQYLSSRDAAICETKQHYGNIQQHSDISSDFLSEVNIDDATWFLSESQDFDQNDFRLDEEYIEENQECKNTLSDIVDGSFTEDYVSEETLTEEPISVASLIPATSSIDSSNKATSSASSLNHGTFSLSRDSSNPRKSKLPQIASSTLSEEDFCYSDNDFRYSEEHVRLSQEAVHLSEEYIRHTEEALRYSEEAIRHSEESVLFSEENIRHSDEDISRTSLKDKKQMLEDRKENTFSVSRNIDTFSNDSTSRDIDQTFSMLDQKHCADLYKHRETSTQCTLITEHNVKKCSDIQTAKDIHESSAGEHLLGTFDQKHERRSPYSLTKPWKGQDTNMVAKMSSDATFSIESHNGYAVKAQRPRSKLTGKSHETKSRSTQHLRLSNEKQGCFEMKYSTDSSDGAYFQSALVSIAKDRDRAPPCKRVRPTDQYMFYGPHKITQGVQCTSLTLQPLEFTGNPDFNEGCSAYKPQKKIHENCGKGGSDFAREDLMAMSTGKRWEDRRDPLGLMDHGDGRCVIREGHSAPSSSLHRDVGDRQPRYERPRQRHNKHQADHRRGGDRRNVRETGWRVDRRQNYDVTREEKGRRARFWADNDDGAGLNEPEERRPTTQPGTRCEGSQQGVKDGSRCDVSQPASSATSQRVKDAVTWFLACEPPQWFFLSIFFLFQFLLGWFFHGRGD